MLLKVRLVAYLLSLAMIFCVNPNEDNNTEFNLYAQSAVLMDADSGRILYGKNEDEIMANASTTKILTCILALEMGDLEGYAKVSKVAARMPKVHLGMQEGQYFKLEDLLYSLMLESHNDSAVVIAEYIAGSVEGFSYLMNEKAKSIGCLDTYFITPNGLDAVKDDKFHSTTAGDLAKIMSYCVKYSPKKDKFLEICQKNSHSFYGYKEGEEGFAKNGRLYQCTNKNSFLSMMNGVVAGKTGFTNKAGYCYVAALKSEERTFVVSLLACGWPNNKTYKWKDTKKLFEYGLKNYHYEDVRKEIILPAMEAVGGIPYGPKQIPVYVCDNTDDIKLLMGKEDEVLVKVYLPDMLNAPVKKEECIGYVHYCLNGKVIKKCEIRTKRGVKKNSYKWSLKYIFKNFIFSEKI